MARKVLISFLGTGSPQKEKDPREYRKATYGFYTGYPDGNWDDIITTPFIAAALRKHFNIEHQFIIGTVMSMWDVVYSYFNDNGNGSDFDMEIWDNISDFIHCRLRDPSLPQGHTLGIENFEHKWLDAINNSINGESVLIKYGLSNDEILFNQERILELSQKLERGDELYIDLTHGFRSLPMYLMNVLIYLQNVRPDISIKCVTYGMLDVNREFDGVTPVVELTSLLEVSQWITGAYAFQQFGQGYMIADLLGQDPASQSEAKLIRRFSDSLNLNDVTNINNSTSNFIGINPSRLSPIGSMTIGPIVKEFRKDFGDVSGAKFLIRLCMWQVNRKNYSAAIITTTEAIKRYVLELNQEQLDMKLKDNGWHQLQSKQYIELVRTVLAGGRDELLDSIDFPASEWDFGNGYVNISRTLAKIIGIQSEKTNIQVSIKEFLKRYFMKVNNNRNDVAHLRERGASNTNQDDIINRLTLGIPVLRKIIN